MSVSAMVDSRWSAALAAAIEALGDPALAPARVFGERRGVYTLRRAGATVSESATVAGRLRHRLQGAAALPVVGDWVAVAGGGAGEARAGTASPSTIIQAVLPRSTAISRRAAGDRDDEQVLAANVDTAVLLMGLDGDFNLRRLERYITLARTGGAAAVVLLTKADLLAAPEAEARAAAVRAAAPELPVATAALVDGALPPALTERLVPAHTLVFLGSSGVGKSTLLNRLAGDGLQRTGSVRASDSRGRHTTSYRQMFELPGGALVIDTPGLREIQLIDPGAAGASPLGEVFPEIAAAAAGCRFRDCRHTAEPGCALPAAIRSGDASQERLASFQRLQSERERRPRPGPARRRVR